MKRILEYSLVFLSAFLMGLSQHPIGLGFLAYIALIPMIPILVSLKSYKRATVISFFWGFLYNLITVYWIAFNIGTSPEIAFLTMILTVLILTTGPLFAFLVWCQLNKRGASLYLFSFIWPSIELLRSYGSLGFPWTSFANSQLDYYLIIQNAEFVGMYGITFWIVLVNLLLFKMFTNRSWNHVFYLLAVVILPLIFGKVILNSNYQESSIDSVRVASVQPNIHLSEKRKPGAQKKIISTIVSQSSEILNSKIDLLVWPETSTISYILQNNKYGYKKIKDMLASYNTKLIAGIPYYERNANSVNYYNSAAYFNSSGLIGLYHKINLVPGAEYIPLSHYVNSLDVLNFGQGNFAHGYDYTIFDISKYKFGTMICLESTFPYLSREFVNKGANFLVYVVNDGWYETPPEPQQHSKRAIYRAIETRRPIIRCANTGISMIIDELGNIKHKLELNKKGVILANIYPKDRITFYVRYGDIFIYFMMLIIILHMFKPIRYEEYV